MTTLTAPAGTRNQVLTDLEALEDLAPEWFDLWRRCPDAVPFQTPEWLLAWWQHFGGGELSVLTMRAGQRLVALAPLFFYRYQGRRQVSPLGIGISDYLGGVWEPDTAAEAVQAV